MKKMVKVVCLLTVLTVIFIIGNSVYALGNGFDANIFNSINNQTVGKGVSDFGSRIMGSIIVVLRVLAVGGVVYMGVKYMYSGSSDKAAIKQSLIYAVVGAIFVFAATGIINFIKDLNIL